VIGRSIGEVVAARGALLDVALPFARVGEGVRISGRDAVLHARVAALHGARATVTPFGDVAGVAAGDRVVVDPSVLALPLGTPLLGRALDAVGFPLDGRSAAQGRAVSIDAGAPPVDVRRPCRGAFWTGVRAIDGPLAFARGARIGVFGSPGAGKSSLLDAIVEGAHADAVVVALIGERGREAERRLARVGARTTLVCATSDRAPAERVRAAEVAFAQAAALRARGLKVLLVLDSLARICAAQRELGLAAGEPAGRGGFPPSTFALLGRLLERAGAT
jgi:type III secretion protein N (ATPase)